MLVAPHTSVVVGVTVMGVIPKEFEFGDTASTNTKN